MGTNIFLFLFSILEIPLYILTAAVAFLAARKLKGGVFGSGMQFISTGMLIIALGNVYFFLQSLPGVGLAVNVWGLTGDTLVLFAYPVVSATFLLIGFFKFIRLPSIYAKTSPGTHKLHEKDKHPPPFAAHT